MSPDTEIALLLCGHFSGRSVGPKPFSLREWNQLADWLRDRSLRPADLPDALDGNLATLPFELERVQGLLGRGMAMSIAIERWAQYGIWVLGRSDPGYPGLWRKRLKRQCPAFIFGVGDHSLLNSGGVAVVGSRDVDPLGLSFTEALGACCAAQDLLIVSGAARGVDRAAMSGALQVGGYSVGVVAKGLTKESTAKIWRDAIRDGRLALVSAVSPDAGFNTGSAMSRNKLIYSLAHAGIVVHSANGSGGTWTGATECLSANWVPVYVRRTSDAGNLALLANGALPLPNQVLDSDYNLSTLLMRSSSPDEVTGSPSETLFTAFLNLLQRELGHGPKAEDELQRTFDLEPTQLRYWLSLAKSRDRVIALADGRLALAALDGAEDAGQLSLFIS